MIIKKYQLLRTVIGQRTNYNKQKDIMSNKKIRKEWENFIDIYKNYFLSDEDKWYNNLDQIKKFIDINKIIPTIKSNKLLHSWIGNQK